METNDICAHDSQKNTMNAREVAFDLSSLAVCCLLLLHQLYTLDKLSNYVSRTMNWAVVEEYRANKKKENNCVLVPKGMEHRFRATSQTITGYGATTVCGNPFAVADMRRFSHYRLQMQRRSATERFGTSISIQTGIPHNRVHWIAY